MVAFSIQRVSIVDDMIEARETLLDEFRGLLDAHALTGPFDSAESLIAAVKQYGDAAICDHHLIANYAPCSGAVVVARLYDSRYPAVLRTMYGKADVDLIRLHRRNIPVLMPPTDFEPDSFLRAWETCQREFAGEYAPDRRPWRTLVRIEDVAEDGVLPVVYVIIPGWNSREVIRLPRALFPTPLHSVVRAGERFFAQVNKGAESQEELYFTDFEHAGA